MQPLQAYFAAHPTRRIALIGLVLLSTIMPMLDQTICNVALPHMQGSLNASQDQISWVLTSYVIASAIGMAATGYLTKLLGRTRLIVGSIVGFTITSVMCGLAQSLEAMVVFRILQGLSSACLVPHAQTILMDIFPREKFGRAMTMWGMGVMIAPIVGPTLGGFLTETYNWRWVFFINIPFGILCTVGMVALLPETTREKTYFDFRGFIFAGFALGALQLMLDRGQTQDWFSSNEIIIEALIAVLAFYLFLVHSLTTTRPFINLAIFKDRNYWAGTLVAFLCNLPMMSTIALLPSMAQLLMGYPVMTTGLLMMPRGIGTLFAMWVAERLIAYMDPRHLMIVGFLITAYSLRLMSGFTLETPSEHFLIASLFQGLGFGIIFPPANVLAFATMPLNLRTEAAAMASLIRNLGNSVGISIAVTLIARNTQISHASLSEHINPFSQALQSATSAASIAGDAAVALGINETVTRQASMIAYLDNFHLMYIMMFALIPMLLILKKPPRKVATPPETVHMEA